jgi:hypothetical protein
MGHGAGSENPGEGMRSIDAAQKANVSPLASFIMINTAAIQLLKNRPQCSQATDIIRHLCTKTADELAITIALTLFRGNADEIISFGGIFHLS